jgi:uncharacterized membrane protein
MTGIGLAALLRRREPWHRDATVVVLCMTGCAAVAFIPPAYFDGISTARHMAVMNLALALAFAMSVTLMVSMVGSAARGRRGTRSGPSPPRPVTGPDVPDVTRQTETTTSP